jgi:hypothetical protein
MPCLFVFDLSDAWGSERSESLLYASPGSDLSEAWPLRFTIAAAAGLALHAEPTLPPEAEGAASTIRLETSSGERLVAATRLPDCSAAFSSSSSGAAPVLYCLVQRAALAGPDEVARALAAIVAGQARLFGPPDARAASWTRSDDAQRGGGGGARRAFPDRAAALDAALPAPGAPLDPLLVARSCPTAPSDVLAPAVRARVCASLRAAERLSAPLQAWAPPWSALGSEGGSFRAGGAAAGISGGGATLPPRPLPRATTAADACCALFLGGALAAATDGAGGHPSLLLEAARLLSALGLFDAGEPGDLGTACLPFRAGARAADPAPRLLCAARLGAAVLCRIGPRPGRADRAGDHATDALAVVLEALVEGGGLDAALGTPPRGIARRGSAERCAALPLDALAPLADVASEAPRTNAGAPSPPGRGRGRLSAASATEDPLDLFPAQRHGFAPLDEDAWGGGPAAAPGAEGSPPKLDLVAVHRFRPERSM